jgi:hypothetical protein
VSGPPPIPESVAGPAEVFGVPAIKTQGPAPSQEVVLRRLFLTLFLRGRSSRGLKKDQAPKSVARKLALTLLFYGLFGLFALAFLRQPLFALSIYLHAMTMVFLGMFVAASAGEVLFNKEEGDILLHRPISAKDLLRAKIGVLVRVSLWLAGAFNLIGLVTGVFIRDGGWLFPLAHVISTTLEALFCTGFVVLTYQLCLRWFGRERLDGVMTTAQVFVSILAVMGGQLAPQLIARMGNNAGWNAAAWWMGLLPPAWFGAMDSLVTTGKFSGGMVALASAGLAGTIAVTWLAFGKLTRNYETGLQTLSEGPSSRPMRAPKWLKTLVGVPPLRWWLRDSMSRAAFLLVAAYLMRDRDVKLRVYPGLAPILVFPLLFLFGFGGRTSGTGFATALSSAYVGLVPLLALNLLQYSQQWQASDLFRAAPMAGPGPLCHGARRAVLLVLTAPVLILFAGIAYWRTTPEHLLLFLPGLIMLPVYSLVPCLGGKGVPLALPTDEAKSAGRALTMFGVMIISLVISGLAVWSQTEGFLQWFLLVETIVAVVAYTVLRSRIGRAKWVALE